MGGVKRWTLLLGSIFGTLFGGAWLSTRDLGFAARMTGILALAALGGISIIAVYFFAIFMLTLGTHELGHYVAGRMVDFKFNLAVVGPLGIRVEAGRIVFHRVKPAWNGGYVSMAPPDNDRIDARLRIFVLGGPMASLLLLLLILSTRWLLGFLLDPPNSTELSPKVGLVLASFGPLTTFAAVVFVVNLIPFQHKSGMPSDGKQLLLLRSNSAQTLRFVSLIDLYRLHQSGTHARDLPTSVIDQAMTLQDETHGQLMALSFKWAHELSRSAVETEEAAVAHEELLAKIGPSLLAIYRESAEFTQTTHTIFARQDAEEGRRKLDRLSTSGSDFASTKSLLEAGLSALEGDSELPARIDAAETALAVEAKKSNRNLDWERVWLQAMREGWPNHPSLIPLGPVASD